jgi:hypothetical protein
MLEIDHVLGNGKEHREELNIVFGEQFYRWLVRNNFPDDYQTLCSSCNGAKGRGKECPHQQSLRDMLMVVAGIPMTY